MAEFEERFPDLYLSTESETRDRVAAVLPTTGSEDATHVLGSITIPEAVDQSREKSEYLPEPSSEWVVTVTLADDVTLPAKAVADLFDREWRKQFGGLTIHGKSAESGLWTFLISADGPKGVSALKFAWPYYATWIESPQVTEKRMFEARIDAVKNQISSLTNTFEVVVDVNSDEATNRSRFLSRLSEQLSGDVSIRVKTANGNRFEGKNVWDVMLCLGLQWGDMDCFHWPNESGVGDDYFFSVWTTTPPGYFLPEQIAAGQTQVDDLVLSFTLPRSANPEEVFDAMLKAAGYVQRRLGGVICDVDGNPVDEESFRLEIRRRVQELEDSGFPPGSDAALRFF